MVCTLINAAGHKIIVGLDDAFIVRPPVSGEFGVPVGAVIQTGAGMVAVQESVAQVAEIIRNGGNVV